MTRVEERTLFANILQKALSLQVLKIGFDLEGWHNEHHYPQQCSATAHLGHILKLL